MCKSLVFAGVAAVACFFCLTARGAAPPGTQPGVVHFHRVSITDPQMNGAEACTLLVPADWKIDGGVVWDIQQIYFPAGLKMTVSNPAGDRQVGFYPALHFCWFNNPIGQQLKPPGSRYMGALVTPVVGDCKTALARIAWPATHGNIAGAKIVDFTDLPDLAKAYQANLPALPGVQYTVKAGKLRVEYQDPKTGAAVQEDLVGVLSIVPYPALQSVGWHIDRLVSFKAPAGTLDDSEKEMIAVASSLRVNVHWFAGYVQVVQTLMKIVQNNSNAAVQRSQIRFQAQQQISDEQMKSWQQQQDAVDKSNEAFDRVIRGVDEYQNPDGSKIELPNTYSHAWSNGAGDYIMSNDALYNPNSNQQGSWQQLQTAKN